MERLLCHTQSLALPRLLTRSTPAAASPAADGPTGGGGAAGCGPDAPPFPPARPEVETLQAYSAPLEGRRGLLRLDFNENTVGPSPKVVEALRAIPADHIAIYPEYDGLREAVLASLRSTAAPGHRGTDGPGSGSPAACRPAEALQPDQIGLFNGVDAAIHAVFQAYGAPGDRLLTTSPTFGYYTPCARMQGMAIEAIPYELPGFGFPLAAIRASLLGPTAASSQPSPPAASGQPLSPQATVPQTSADSTVPLTTSPASAGSAGSQPASPPAAPGRLPGAADAWTPPRLLLICNPNNPTGTRLAPERILELAAAAPQTLVVVDELYEAFTGDSVLPLLLERSGGDDPFASLPNLLVLRSLAKTAGLAGLRIGFAIGHAAVVDRVSRVTGPYDINSFAVTAAFAALADQPYVDAYVAEVLRARDWLVEQLQGAGVRHHAAGGNYLLLWPEADPAEVERRLRDEAGILVRSMAGKPLIDGSLRVSLGTLEQMRRFWQAWQAITASAAPLPIP